MAVNLFSEIQLVISKKDLFHLLEFSFHQHLQRKVSTSTGKTAFMPYIREKGVSQVMVQMEVLYACNENVSISCNRNILLVSFPKNF